jgi:hypothetical protein
MRKAKKAAPKKTLTAAEVDERRSEAFFQMLNEFKARYYAEEFPL